MAVVVLVIGTVVARRLGYKIGGSTIVRCRQGHLFTAMERVVAGQRRDARIP